MRTRSNGFTVIELLVVVVVLLGASILFFNQKSHIEAASRDSQRKANINTIYHNLEKIYYTEHKSYPKTVDERTLPALPDDTFIDPDGLKINTSESSNFGLSTTYSSYHYDPTNCQGNECEGYTLRASLENEADYTKKSLHSSSTKDKKE